MKRLPLILLAFIGFEVVAQSLPSIQLDRPDQTECPFLTPIKYIQVENGANFERISSNSKSGSIPTSLWKYGINKNLELRVITEFLSIKNANDTLQGMSPITVGFKVRLMEDRGLIPKTSLICHVSSRRIAKREFQTSNMAPSFRFTMQHTISSKVSLAYNVGAEWDGESSVPTYIYTLTSGLSLSSKLGYYIEL